MSREFPNFRRLEKITVYVVTTLEGEGIEENPAREVKTFCNENGEVLFVDDPCPYGNGGDDD